MISTLKNIIEVKNFSVDYVNRGVITSAVRNISFPVGENTLTGLVGESGSGKSTIIMSILGLLPRGTKISGQIIFKGRNIAGLSEKEMRPLRCKEISLVPQSALNSFTPVLTIGTHITEVLRTHLSIDGRSAAKRAEALLEEAGLEGMIVKYYPHELSGGQKQRAAIALALACSPALLLADEPTTALDVVTQAEILKLLVRLQREKGLTVLLVTHDLPMAASVCGRLLVMQNGEIVERGTSKEIISAPKHHHTKALVRYVLK